MGKWFAEYRKETEKEYTFYSGMKRNVKVTIELNYSALHVLGGNPDWYCRSWMNNRIVDESYGKTKYEAYRNAMKSFN